MRRTRAIAFLILLATSALPAMADELWQMAVEHYAIHQDLLPGRMIMRFDQYNGRGNLVSSDYSEMELVVGPDGEVEGRTVLAMRDGRDVTDDQRRNAGGPPFAGGSDDGGDSDSPFAGLMLSPFDPDEQYRVVASDTGRREIVGGMPTRVYRFEHTTSTKGGTVGLVWLDAESGAPVKLSASIEPLPGYVSEFEMLQDFATDPDGRWYMSRMEFVGAGHILFVRRRIESEIVLTDYFQDPSASLN
jgi:hypothetical protein